MTPKTQRRYMNLIQNKVWKEQDIISFRSMLRREEKNPLAKVLLQAFRDKAPYQITQEQTIKGVEWLKKVCFKANGEIRNTKNRPFETWECEQIKEILSNFSHWRFEDVQDHGNGFHTNYVPVYTLVSKDGKEFTYAPSATGERTY